MLLKLTSSLHMLLLCALYVARANSQSSCSVADEELLKQKRIQALRSSILAQLGLTEPPSIPQTPIVVPPDVLENFRIVSQVTNLMEEEREKMCQSNEFFAQPITSFVGSMNVDMNVNSGKRSAEPSMISIQDSSRLLKQYTLSFNFELEKNLSSITQASLLLFQTPASKLNSYITDIEQYVEVKSVVSNSTQVSTSSVMAGKFLNIYEGGFQVFDITSAVKLWALMGLRGDIELQVSVYCIKSSDCAMPDTEGTMPQSVEFVHSQLSTKDAPRLVIASENPLSGMQGNKAKRQTSGGASFCVGNQSTCCLKELIINFQEDLGPEFSFIIDPPSYQANYCEGICPITPGGELMTPLLFDFISRLQNNPASSVTPCCTGHTYQNLPVLLNLYGMVVARTLENVRVSSCRCG